MARCGWDGAGAPDPAPRSGAPLDLKYGTIRQCVVLHPPGPPQHPDVELEDRPRVAAGDHDRHHRHRAEHDEGQPQEGQRDVVRDHQDPFDQPQPAGQRAHPATRPPAPGTRAQQPSRSPPAARQCLHFDPARVPIRPRQSQMSCPQRQSPGFGLGTGAPRPSSADAGKRDEIGSFCRRAVTMSHPLVRGGPARVSERPAPVSPAVPRGPKPCYVCQAKRLTSQSSAWYS